MRGITSRGLSGDRSPGPLLDRPRPGFHPPFPVGSPRSPVLLWPQRPSLTVRGNSSNGPCPYGQGYTANRRRPTVGGLHMFAWLPAIRGQPARPQGVGRQCLNGQPTFGKKRLLSGSTPDAGFSAG